MSDNAFPFTRRFGLQSEPVITEDFPLPSRMALFHVLRGLVLKEHVLGWQAVQAEMERLARIPPVDAIDDEAREEHIRELLEKLPWQRVFEFCERVYSRLLQVPAEWNGQELVAFGSIDDIRQEYDGDVNQLMVEDNFAYEFTSGRFFRPGGRQLQVASSAAQRVLAKPELREARLHYQKAMRFFEGAPEADYPNAVKEAVAALEVSLKRLFPQFKGGDAMRVLRHLRGTGEDQVPPALAGAIENLYGFRGAGVGVAHGGANGGIASAGVAELVLTLTAGLITYLSNLADSMERSLPF